MDRFREFRSKETRKRVHDELEIAFPEFLENFIKFRMSIEERKH